MDATTHKRAQRLGGLRVVGVTFTPGYPQNLLRLATLDAERARMGLLEHLTVVLIRDPDNPHDANAVEVHVPTCGQIGHLCRGDAARVAPLLDDTRHFRVSAWVELVAVHPDHVERPGIDIAVEITANEEV